MKKVLTAVGYVAYEITAEYTEALGGCGICDTCNTPSPTGYLVPVLNRYLCPTCYKEWEQRAQMYPEDLRIEQKNMDYYETVFKEVGLNV